MKTINMHCDPDKLENIDYCEKIDGNPDLNMSHNTKIIMTLD